MKIGVFGSNIYDKISFLINFLYVLNDNIENKSVLILDFDVSFSKIFKDFENNDKYLELIQIVEAQNFSQFNKKVKISPEIFYSNIILKNIKILTSPTIREFLIIQKENPSFFKNLLKMVSMHYDIIIFNSKNDLYMNNYGLVEKDFDINIVTSNVNNINTLSKTKKGIDCIENKDLIKMILYSFSKLKKCKEIIPEEKIFTFLYSTDPYVNLSEYKKNIFKIHFNSGLAISLARNDTVFNKNKKYLNKEDFEFYYEIFKKIFEKIMIAF